MRKRQSGVDLENSEHLELLDVGFDTPYVNTPIIEDNSDSYSFRNNLLRDNQMFNSPIRKSFASDLMTPLGHFPSLGFTPWTPKQMASNNLDMTATKTQLNHHQILNFQEDSLQNYSSNLLRISPRMQSLNSINKSASNNRLKRETTISLNRSQRKRKQIEMKELVQTGQTKCHRGLRNLASRVKQIAMKLGVATSKEIAQALIKQLQQEKQISPKSKEHQNVRRRVYDALKVLVSADVLIRDTDKKLIARPTPAKNSTLQATRTALRQKVASMKKAIQQKTQKAITMNNKFVVGQQLIEHNKSNPSPQSQRIYFPFLGMQTPEDNLQYIESDKSNGSTSIGLNKGRVRLIGDIDLVLELRIFQEKNKIMQTKTNTLETDHFDLQTDLKMETRSLNKDEKSQI